ncbi:MAG: O-antigen ligase family protein, partial [Thioalkalispiraceae bacterium]
WELIKEYPLLGIGSQGFYYIPERIPYIIQPHNMVLQFLVEWGLIGTILFILLLTKGFYYGLKINFVENKQLDKYTLAAGAVIITLTVNGLTSGTYYHPKPLIYLAIAFAIWVIPSKGICNSDTSKLSQ